MPLYIMDHSGITISADPERFRQCDPQGWDWGMVGFAYISRESALSEYGGKQLTPSIKKKSLNALMAEIYAYNQFLQGYVYGFIIKDANGEHVDSCWGFYGFDYCRSEAVSCAA